MRFIALLLLAALAACGNIYEDKRCTDYQYQEDAQAAYGKGATQLDPDGNGKACEELPPRPAPPPVVLADFAVIGSAGASFVAQASGDRYVLLSQSVSSRSSVTSAAAVSPRDVDGGSEIARGDGVVLRYTAGAGGALAAWTPATNLDAAGTGLGWPVSDLADLSQLAGDWKVLGQRCVPGSFSCSVAVATLRIAANGTLDLCVGNEFSSNCANRERRTLTASGLAANLWTLGGTGELLAGSRSQGTLAFSWQDGGGYFTFAGQKNDQTVRNTATPPASVWFDAGGKAQRAVPTLASSAVADQPLQGFYQDGAGSTYLRASSGQLVTWTAGVGLRHHVAR